MPPGKSMIISHKISCFCFVYLNLDVTYVFKVKMPAEKEKIEFMQTSVFLIRSLLWKSMDWFLYDRDLRHERVKFKVFKGF